MKRFFYTLLGIGLAFAGTVYAVQVSVPSAPSSGYFLVSTSTGNYIATTTDPAHVGSIYATSTTATSYLGGNLQINGLAGNGTVCLHVNNSGVISVAVSDCGSGSGGSAPAFTPTSYGASTSTTLGLLGGFFSTASSTQSGNFFLPALSQGILYTGSNGKVGTTATSTFSLSQFINDLANLSATNASLTFTGNYNGSVARTVGINVGNTNTWTILQNFNYSSTTSYASFVAASSTNWLGGGLGTCTGSSFLQYTSTGFFGCGTPAGAGTVTSVIAGAGFQNQGLNITNSGTLVSAFATSATPVLGNLSYYTGIGDASNPAKLGTVATTTLSGSGVIGVTAGAVVIGTAPISISCATCGTGSVTSVGSASGITGGTITTSGTLSLVNWLATSSQETNGQIPYWTTTNGWPAKLNSVGTSSIASGVGITVTNGSTAFVLGAQPSVACNTANATTFGCLATTDFNNFSNKVATSASETSSQVAYFTTTNGTPAKIQGVATSTIGADGASLSNSGTTGFQIGGGNNTISLNLGHTNTWTVLQNFNYSSSTIYSSFLTSSSTFAQIGKLTLSTTTTGCLNTSSTGVVYAGSCGAGGSPAGSDTQIQFNKVGSFGATTTLSYVESSGDNFDFNVGDPTFSKGLVDTNINNSNANNPSANMYIQGTGDNGDITLNASGITSTAIAGTYMILEDNKWGSYTRIGTGSNTDNAIIQVQAASTTKNGFIDFSTITGSDKTFTLPNETGTFALGTGSTGNCANWTDANTLGTTGSPCGSGGGLSSYDAWTHPFTSLYSATTSVISIGTSTPSYAQLTLATSTVPQLSLGDGSTGHNQWTFNNNAGTLNLATASPTTYAVNSTPSISISDSGFGTTTLNVPLKVKTDASMYRAIEVSSAGGQGIFVTTTGDSHALGADYNNTNGNGSAINATSNNANTSAVQISGAETGVATLKLTHTGVAGANASLVNFSSNNAGYLGQGLFMSVLAAADTQKILNLRGNNAERMTFLVGGQLGLGVTNPGFQLQISTTTASNTFKPQLGLTDSASASGLKNWTLSSEGGNLYIATATDAFATSSITAFALDKNGFLTLKADAGVGCGQFDANGKLTNTGSACDTNTGTVTSVVAGAGFQNQGLNITTSGTLVTAFASSSNPTLSNVPYVTGVGDVSNPIKFGFLATTTLAGGGPITVSNSPVLFGASGAVLGCTNASSGITGCLTGTDWNTFNGKLGSYDPFTHPFTSLYSATSSVMMFGTTTPDYAQLTLATSTQPQLALTDGTNNAQWSVRSVGSNLYFATTSPTTFATTSPAAFSIVGTGYPIFGVGTTSPFAVASIVNLNPSAVPLFTVSSSTATGSAMPVFEIDSVGHYQSSGPKPTVSACGTGSPSVVGNDNAMVVTTGSGAATECTVTFANTWAPNTPICSFDDQSNSSITITGSTTATTLKIGLSASLTSANIGVLCEGYQ